MSEQGGVSQFSHEVAYLRATLFCDSSTIPLQNSTRKK